MGNTLLLSYQSGSESTSVPTTAKGRPPSLAISTALLLITGRTFFCPFLVFLLCLKQVFHCSIPGLLIFTASLGTMEIMREKERERTMQ